MSIQGLVLYPKYGLANRLRALASAKILADYTGRKLFVNWYPSKECNIEWEELFVNRLERYPSPLSSFQTGINLYDDEKDADGFYWDMPQALLNNRTDVIAVHTCYNFQLREMTKEAYIGAKSLFYKGLKPVHTVEESVRDIHTRYFEGNDVVGVHIRRTDHLCYIKKDPRLVCPTDLFIKVIGKILRNNFKTKFFLATDDKQEERRISRMFQDAVIVYEKEAVHRDTKKGIQDALVDWLLLSKTSKIISSYLSSFSEEAGVVNMIKNDYVLKAEELSRLHYKAILKEHFKGHWEVLRKEGLNKYFQYSYNYRKRQLINWIRKKKPI
jgi:hypothetical protein